MAGFGSKTQGLFNAPKGPQVTRQSRYVVFQQVEEYLRLVGPPAEPYKVLSSAHPGGQAMRLQNSPGQIRPSTAMEGCAGAIRAAVRPRPLEPAARPEPGQLHASLRGETFAATRNNARSARKRRRPVTHRCASRCCAVSRSGSRHRREPSETPPRDAKANPALDRWPSRGRPGTAGPRRSIGLSRASAGCSGA
jgi:hypothetical protein